MIAGLIMGLLAVSSVGLIKLAHGKDAKIKIPQIFLLIAILGLWSMSLFFLILDMASKDYWLCVITSIIIPIILAIWIFMSRRKLPKQHKTNYQKSFENAPSHTENNCKIRFCRKCGEELIENSRFCRKCGTEIVKENKNDL